MPSSTLKPDVRSPASILCNGAVKRKSDEDDDDHEPRWDDSELSWEGSTWPFNQTVKRRCTGQPPDGNNIMLENTGEESQLNDGGQSLQMQLPSQPAEHLAVVQSDENFNGGVESLETDMEVDCGDGDIAGQNRSTGGQHLVETSSQQEHQQAVVSNSEYSCCVERMYRSLTMPRCYCRPSWDPGFDLIPYVSDIY